VRIVDHHQAHGLVARGPNLGVENFRDRRFHRVVPVNGIEILAMMSLANS
jgi:hypothetical protein